MSMLLPFICNIFGILLTPSAVGPDPPLGGEALTVLLAQSLVVLKRIT